MMACWLAGLLYDDSDIFHDVLGDFKYPISLQVEDRQCTMQLSKALVGFLQYKAAEGLSPNTLRNYKDHITR